MHLHMVTLLLPISTLVILLAMNTKERSASLTSTFLGKKMFNLLRVSGRAGCLTSTQCSHEGQQNLFS